MRTTGQVLITFGRACCNVATAQEALGRSLGSSLIVALQRFLDQIKDYEVEKKKLETRRWE
jgi:SWI/SNF-related matrix-associated actin-dependent regulator of chromatin subfamily D